MKGSPLKIKIVHVVALLLNWVTSVEQNQMLSWDTYVYHGASLPTGSIIPWGSSCFRRSSENDQVRDIESWFPPTPYRGKGSPAQWGRNKAWKYILPWQGWNPRSEEDKIKYENSRGWVAYRVFFWLVRPNKWLSVRFQVNPFKKVQCQNFLRVWHLVIFRAASKKKTPSISGWIEAKPCISGWIEATPCISGWIEARP